MQFNNIGKGALFSEGDGTFSGNVEIDGEKIRIGGVKRTTPRGEPSMPFRKKSVRCSRSRRRRLRTALTSPAAAKSKARMFVSLRGTLRPKRAKTT